MNEGNCEGQAKRHVDEVLRDSCYSARASAWSTIRSSASVRAARLPELFGEVVAGPEIFVGDVQGGQDRQADGVARGRRLGRPAPSATRQTAPAPRRNEDRARYGSGTSARGPRLERRGMSAIYRFSPSSCLSMSVTPALDQVALFAQRHHFGAGAFGAADPRLERVDLGPQLAVFFGHPGLLALDAR